MDIRCRPCGSIRNRLLVFAILVTLVPSMGMGWFWYSLSRQTTTAKVEQTLRASAGIVEREVELWFKECSYDLQVFSSAATVYENTPLVHGDEAPPSEKTAAARIKLTTYLNIIISKFPHYQRLAIINTQGRILVNSGPPAQAPILLPDNWQQQIVRNRYFVGSHFMADSSGNQRILVGTSLPAAEDGTPLGLMILEADLEPLHAIFAAALPRDTVATGTDITLLDAKHKIIFRITADGLNSIPGDASIDTLPPVSGLALLHAYTGLDQVPVLGIAFPITGHPWYQLLELSRDEVYADLLGARNRILLLTALLTMIIGGASIIVARQIIFPLRDLLHSARQVADGDLSAEVPVTRDDELGTVATMFNHMVTQLRIDQNRLLELATTDPLTGLANRKQLMTNLHLQLEAFRRHDVCFALLLLDIDFFKKVNDNYGHLAGDSVLIGVAGTLRSTLRKLDTAARYGGEEFVVVLDTTDIEQARLTAERIRQAVENQIFVWEEQELQVTVSIGVGSISTNDRSTASLIARVDAALYRAKSEGRNRVCLAEIPDTLSHGH